MAIKSTAYLYTESFLVLPRSVFENDSLSLEEVALYILLLDRCKLSEQNGLRDELGLFVFCTLEDAASFLRCGRNKALAAFKGLLKKGLIQKERQGCGRANRYYVNALLETAPLPEERAEEAPLPEEAAPPPAPPVAQEEKAPASPSLCSAAVCSGELDFGESKSRALQLLADYDSKP